MTEYQSGPEIVKKTNFSQRVGAVRSARYALGLSQVELANDVGLSKTSIARFETLIAPLSENGFDAIIKRFNALGVRFEFRPDRVTLLLSGEALQYMCERLKVGKRKK